MPKLICMNFRGEYQNEKSFDTIEECWEHSNDIGSRWFFYPFHFVVSDSGKTIIDGPHLLEKLNRKRVKTVQEIFKNVADLPESQNLDSEDFVYELHFIIQ